MSAGLLAGRLLVEPRHIRDARVYSSGEEEGGWGAPPEPVEVASFPVFAHRQSAPERVRAGKESATLSYVLYALDPLPEVVTERKSIRVDGEDALLNITAVIPRPTEGITIIEAEGSG